MVLQSSKSPVIQYCVSEIVKNMVSLLQNHLSSIILINILNVLREFLLLVPKVKEEEELAAFNHFVLRTVENYWILSEEWKRIEEKENTYSIQQLFFEVWKLIIQELKKVKGKKTGANTSLFIQDCVLSNDDFFMLCNPQLQSFEEGYKRCCEVMKEIQKELPFTAEMYAEVESEYDSLFV